MRRPSLLETEEDESWIEKKKLKIDYFIHCGETAGSKDIIRRGSTSGQTSVCSCVENVYLWKCTVSDAYGDFP